MFTKIILFFPLMSLILTVGTDAIASTEKNALDYLPPSRFLGSWQATGNELVSSGRDVQWLLPDDYDLLQEFGLVMYATEIYSNSNKEMTIEIFEFPSASDAFGFYALSSIGYSSAYIDDSQGVRVTVKPYSAPPAAEVDTIRIIENKFLEGYKDKFYYRLRIEQDTISQELMKVAVYIQGTLPGSAMKADLVASLPKSGLVFGTERYLRGVVGLNLLMDWNYEDILGFGEREWKAVAGEYRLGGGEYYLLIVAEYSDNDSAKISADQLQVYFQRQGWEPVVTPPLSNGGKPRAFLNKTGAAFWATGKKLFLIWDTSSLTSLQSALKQQDK